MTPAEVFRLALAGALTGVVGLLRRAIRRLLTRTTR